MTAVVEWEAGQDREGEMDLIETLITDMEACQWIGEITEEETSGIEKNGWTTAGDFQISIEDTEMTAETTEEEMVVTMAEETMEETEWIYQGTIGTSLHPIETILYQGIMVEEIEVMTEVIEEEVYSAETANQMTWEVEETVVSVEKENKKWEEWWVMVSVSSVIKEDIWQKSVHILGEAETDAGVIMLIDTE